MSAKDDKNKAPEDEAAKKAAEEAAQAAAEKKAQEEAEKAAAKKKAQEEAKQAAAKETAEKEAAAKKAAAGQTYEALHPIRRNGEHIAPGGTLSLTAKEAAPLLRLQAIRKT